MLAATLRPDMADRYVEVEPSIGHSFRADFTNESIVLEARRRQADGGPLPAIKVWSDTGGACAAFSDDQPALELELQLAA